MREDLAKKDMRRFLDFLRTDGHFCRYFDGIYILIQFNTGFRISEFCGFILDAIDCNNHAIYVCRQLLCLYEFLYIETFEDRK